MAKLFNVVPKSGHTAFLQIEIIYFLIKVCFELNLFREKFPTFKIHPFVWPLIFFILIVRPDISFSNLNKESKLPNSKSFSKRIGFWGYKSSSVIV